MVTSRLKATRRLILLATSDERLPGAKLSQRAPPKKAQKSPRGVVGQRARLVDLRELLTDDKRATGARKTPQKRLVCPSTAEGYHIPPMVCPHVLLVTHSRPVM